MNNICILLIFTGLFIYTSIICLCFLFPSIFLSLSFQPSHFHLYELSLSWFEPPCSWAGPLEPCTDAGTVPDSCLHLLGSGALLRWPPCLLRSSHDDGERAPRLLGDCWGLWCASVSGRLLWRDRWGTRKEDVLCEAKEQSFRVCVCVSIGRKKCG